MPLAHTFGKVAFQKIRKETQYKKERRKSDISNKDAPEVPFLSYWDVRLHRSFAKSSFIVSPFSVFNKF